MSDLLRQYETWECGTDGYPFAWHGPMYSAVLPDGLRAAIAIKDLIREQADYRCLRCGHPYPPGIADTHPRGEWTPCDEHCTHDLMDVRSLDDALKNEAVLDAAGSGRRQAHWRILTVHHLDEDKTNCRWWNLAALCQRCHLRMQRAVVMDRVYHYEHSEWFKPFAAGFYAWKYLGEDLGREEIVSRLPALLALEHRFTQEVLL